MSRKSFLQSIKQDYITAVEYTLFHIALRLPPACDITVPGDAKGNNFQSVPGASPQTKQGPSRASQCWVRTPPPLPPVRVGTGMHWKGGRYPRAPSLCPATVPLTPSARFNGICNRQ